MESFERSSATHELHPAGQRYRRYTRCFRGTVNWADQGMLFGTSTEGNAVSDHVAQRELRLCALNVQSASPARAPSLVDWLLASESNVLVLTELTASDGCAQLTASLRAEGFSVSMGRPEQDDKYRTAVGAKGFVVTEVRPVPFNPRIVAVDLTSSAGTFRVVGIYGPSNNLTAESSQRRIDFQQRCLDYLARIRVPGMYVAGDLNVPERGPRADLGVFESHDYAFYAGLLALGLVDAYRYLHPEDDEYSWSGPRFGSQRLDHVLVDESATIASARYDHEPRAKRLSDHSAVLTTILVAPL